MAFDQKLAERVRLYFHQKPLLQIEEKRMFGGLAFMINGKMCVNISKDRLMCRFDHKRTEELTPVSGYMPMVMKNRVLKGYCYVEPHGFESERDFSFWIEVCLEFNDRAKSSKK